MSPVFITFTFFTLFCPKASINSYKKQVHICLSVSHTITSKHGNLLNSKYAPDQLLSFLARSSVSNNRMPQITECALRYSHAVLQRLYPRAEIIPYGFGVSITINHTCSLALLGFSTAALVVLAPFAVSSVGTVDFALAVFSETCKLDLLQYKSKPARYKSDSFSPRAADLLWLM